MSSVNYKGYSRIILRYTSILSVFCLYKQCNSFNSLFFLCLWDVQHILFWSLSTLWLIDGLLHFMPWRCLNTSHHYIRAVEVRLPLTTPGQQSVLWTLKPEQSALPFGWAATTHFFLVYSVWLWCCKVSSFVRLQCQRESNLLQDLFFFLV